MSNSTAPAPFLSTAELFGAAPTGKVETYTSKKFSGKLNLEVRGNFRFFGAALATGILVDSLPFCNPNKVGRAGCFDYCSERFGKLSIYTVEGRTYVRISDKEVREDLISRLGEDVTAILERIAADYNEVIVSADKVKLTRKVA